MISDMKPEDIQRGIDILKEIDRPMEGDEDVG